MFFLWFLLVFEGSGPPDSMQNPTLNEIPVLVHGRELHESGPTRIIPFDLKNEIGTEYPATSPNLMAYFMRILPGEELDTTASATSQAFYVIRGAGTATSNFEIDFSNEFTIETFDQDKFETF